MKIKSVFKLVFIFVFLSIALPSYAVLPFHPDDVKKYQELGIYDDLMQEWIDFKEANPPGYYNAEDLLVVPDKIESIEKVLRGDVIARKGEIDLDGNGTIDERDFLELGYPVQRGAQYYYAPSEGEQRSIVILVDFNDRVGNPDHGSIYFADMLFSDEGRNNPSMRDYFHEVSMDRLDCIGTVADSGENSGWLRVDANASDYFGYDNNRTLIELAIDLADPYVDFTQFDHDGDKYIESIMVVVSGEGKGGEFWPHKWFLESPKQVDGVYVYPYFLATEDSKVGTFAHEHGHAMGLPDLYDYDSSSYGVGYWCIMGYGCWGGDGAVPVHMSAWCKYQLGWLDFVNVEESIVNAEIPGTPGNEIAYKLKGNMIGQHEYFLVENRRKVSYDRKLPGEGVLIWHINLWGDQNNDNYRKVDLEEADGNYDIDHKNNLGDATDPYYFESGNFEFTKYTDPNSNDRDGRETGISVLQISEQGELMYAILKNKPEAVEGIDTVDPEPATPRR